MTGRAVVDGGLAMDGVFNFRDLGSVQPRQGPAIKSGMVFRSDGLHRAPVAQQEQLADLGIGRVIDLRTDQEIEREGRFRAGNVDFVRIPVVEQMGDLARMLNNTDTGSGTDLLAAHYVDLAERNGSAFATAIDVVASSVRGGQPVVFHCTAGKDRTGILAGLLLRGLNVDAGAVAEDYGRSSAATSQMIAWYREHSDVTPAQRMNEMGMDPSMIDVVMGSDPTSMMGFLDTMTERYGTVGGYLSEIGAADAVRTIAEHLIDR